mmetsp:Transcript_39577/g.117535  ORF Transcript_39577/g.117535 Transcript_39577/m.117535 type:complete len:211 (+) Transcript_39577:1-633(+)
MHRAGRVPALPPQPGAAAHHTEVAAPARHACLLLVGRSQRHAAPAGLLVMETGRRQRWMVPGGYVDRGDDDAAHAAFREMGEELLGLGKRAAAAQARHLLAQARHTGVLRGPFVSADGSHHAFAVLADGLVGSGGGIDGALEAFVRNRECAAAALVPLSDGDGLPFVDDADTRRASVGGCHAAGTLWRLFLCGGCATFGRRRLHTVTPLC